MTKIYISSSILKEHVLIILQLEVGGFELWMSPLETLGGAS